ncbi:hypothetical protein GCM10009765_19930 [Fodinicola feengrottensis]|uniref:Serine/threonine protein kinase n=2 Tax=Fodinicola feengrottensis TaxID=435914 RepID=A0ABN2GFU0_9ACTN
MTKASGPQAGPYQLLKRLGDGELGGVFLAADSAGRHAIVAQLIKGAAEADQQRFAEAVRALALGEADGAGVLGAEPKAKRPWVATALGNPTGAETLFAAFDPTLKIRRPVPRSAADLVPPDPFAGIPATGDTARSRALMPIVVTVAIVLTLCLGLGTAAAVLAGRSTTAKPNASNWTPMDHPMPVTTPSTQPTTPTPSAPSVSPAPEPPTRGSWPAAWKKFSGTDKTRVIDLQGLPLSFRVPESWGCLVLSSSATSTVVSCIDDEYPNSQGPRVRLTFRSCPNSCSATQQRQQRADIETFGQRWITADAQSTYAEAKNVTTTIGSGRYVLVISRFFHSRSGAALDRQLIVTGSSGSDRVGQVQQVVNEIRG